MSEDTTKPLLKLKEHCGRLPSGRWVELREFSPDEWMDFQRRMAAHIKVDEDGNPDFARALEDSDFMIETMRTFVRAYTKTADTPTEEEAAEKGIPEHMWHKCNEGITSWTAPHSTFLDVFPNVIDRQILEQAWKAMHNPPASKLKSFMASDFTTGGLSQLAAATGTKK